MASDEEERSLLEGPVAPHDEEGPVHLHRILESLLNERPSMRDQCAIIFAERCLSFGELNDLANRLARRLLTKTVDDRRKVVEGPWIVVVCMPASERLLAVLFAILKMGAAYLPLDPSFPPARVLHILTESNPLCVVVDGDWPHGTNTTPIMRYGDLLLPSEGREASGDLAPEEMLGSRGECPLACVYYTSGSTGLPCGVLLPHRVVLHRLRWQWRVFPFLDGEVGCLKTVLTFIDSISEIFAPLLRGRCVVVVPRAIVQDAPAFVSLLDRHPIRRLMLVPSHLRAMLIHTKMHPEMEHLINLRWIVLTGEPMPVDLCLDFFAQFGGRDKLLFNFYGCTETMGDVTYETFVSADDVRAKTVEGKLPIGAPIDNTLLFIVGEDGDVLTKGRKGEICISGLSIASGYLVARETGKFVVNRLMVRDGHETLYKTGDHGFMVGGTVYYEGRKDTQIKVRGQRVDMSEIEKAARQIVGVESAVALCYRPNHPNQTIVLFYVPNSVAPATEASVTATLKEIVVSYAMPFVMRVDVLPLLVNGKTDRAALLRRFEECVASGEVEAVDLGDVAEEQAEVATALLTTVASVLGSSRTGPLTLDGNFFRVGGNSLNVMIVLNRLRMRGYCLAVGDFLRAVTFRDIVTKVAFDGRTSPIERDPPPRRRISGVSDGFDIRIQSLFHVDPEAGIDLMSGCFSKKSDLDVYLGITKEDYSTMLTGIWESIVEANLSVAAVDKVGRLLGISINWDANKDLNIRAPPKLQVLMDFLATIEKPHLEKLPKGPGFVLNAMLEGTDVELDAKQNVQVVLALEHENLQIARKNGFQEILTTNTSPLTRDVCQNMLRYESLECLQVNRYVDESGHRVFATAPDTLQVYVAIKHLDTK